MHKLEWTRIIWAFGRQLYSHGLHLSDPRRAQKCSWANPPNKMVKNQVQSSEEVRQGLSMILREQNPFCKVQQLVRVGSTVACVFPKTRQEPSTLTVVNMLVLLCRWCALLLVSLFLGFLAVPPSSSFSCCVTGETAHMPPCTEVTSLQTPALVYILIIQETWS